MSNNQNNNFNQLAKAIRLLLLDVDGVLTDGRLYFSANGDEMKAFSTLDGHGIKMLQKSGVVVGVITGRKSALTEKRCRDLGIAHLVQGREDKWQALTELRDSTKELGDIDDKAIAYMGDDYPDLSIMARIGLPASVPNAAEAVKQRAVFVSEREGGCGAVRELCDAIMQAQGSFDAALRSYLPDHS